MRKLSLRIACMALALIMAASLVVVAVPTHVNAASDIVVTVGASGCDYTTINAALDAIAGMSRSSGQRAVIEIQPGNYEEMLRITLDNITLRNASPNPSTGLTNKGVDIDANAVRITSYYGHGYNYASMNSDYLWDADTLAANKSSGKATTTNAGGTSSTHWNATVVVSGDGFQAEGIIFENSFNQYVSAKAADDVIIKASGAKEGSTPRADLPEGSTTVQEKAYVERAAALAIAKNVQQAYFENCKIIGRQDTLYGGKGATAGFYDCAVYGACDYIFGGMNAVFAKCDLVFNTSEDKNDRGYITAPQQDSGRGYLFYNCTVTSTTPGVDTASQYTSKPGYWGRPWAADTGEAVFYNTIVEAADSHWVSDYGASLIQPAGWLDTLKGESALCGEYGTYEMSGVNNSGSRASWAQVFTSEKLADGTAISVSGFLGSWNPFAGKDMTITLPNGTQQPAPTNPTTSSPSGGTVTEGSYVHNFTSDGKNSSFYSITGNTSTSKGSVSYNGLNLTTALKMESSTNISFTAPSAGTLTLVFGGSTAAGGKKVKVDGSSVTTDSNGIYTASISAGSHTVTKGDSINLFYIVYTPEGSGESGGETHTHSYTAQVISPTCTSDGYTVYTCSCGESYTDDAVASLGHNYVSGSCSYCGAADPNASSGDEYLVRDAFFSLSNSSVNRMTSDHFQIIWGNEDTTGTVNEELVRGNLTNLEKIWDFYVNELGMTPPNMTPGNPNSQKYKLNFYISNTGLGDVVMDDWAYMSSDSENMAYLVLQPGAMRVDEPSWVVPHELAHAFAHHQGGVHPYGFYEAIANWFRDQYLGSTYYAYGNNVYGPTSDFFKPFLVNHDYYFPHLKNWYDAWPLLLYISENPDNIPGLGMEVIHKILETQNTYDNIFIGIEDLSGVSIKTILGGMARRLVTLDFSRQQYYQLRRSEQMTADEISGMYSSLSADGDYWAISADEAPMQGGWNFIPLSFDASKDSLSIELVGTSTEAGAGWTASIVTVTSSGDTRYSPMFGSGEIGTIALQGDETEAYLVVTATPDTMQTLTTYEETAVGTRYSYKMRVVEQQTEHTHNYNSLVTAPTCTANGYTTYTCDCGDTYTANQTSALGHSYVNGSCSRCGAADPNYVAPTQPDVTAGSYVHNFTENGKTSDFYTITGSTSTSKGSVFYAGLTLTTCLKMESSTNISFNAPSAGTLTLVFGGSTAAAGKSVKIDGTSVDVGSDGTVTVDVAAGSHTITKGDSINLFYMIYTPEGGTTEPEPHVHSYSSAVTTQPGCETAGVRTFTCDCGDSYTEAIEAIGHAYSSLVTAPTCTANGYTTYTCSNCGNSYTSNQTAATGHTAKTVAGKDATCTETGLTDGSVCSVCNVTITAQEVIPALGHSYTFEEVYPNCTTDGYIVYTCSACGHSYTEAGMASQGHFYENGSCTYCGAKDPDYVEPDQPEEPPKNGLQKADDGEYYYYVDNEIQTQYTGFMENTAGQWYIENGHCNLARDGMVTVDGTKYLLKSGHVNTAFTGITKQEGVYYYFAEGVNDLEHEGLVYCNGMKAYVQDGEVNFNKSGVVEDGGNLFYVKYGIWRNTFKGLARTDEGNWLYFVNGSFDETYTGVAKLNANWVYVENGYVNFNYSGTITVGNYEYPVKYGVVQF